MYGVIFLVVCICVCIWIWLCLMVGFVMWYVSVWGCCSFSIVRISCIGVLICGMIFLCGVFVMVCGWWWCLMICM